MSDKTFPVTGSAAEAAFDEMDDADFEDFDDDEGLPEPRRVLTVPVAVPEPRTNAKRKPGRPPAVKALADKVAKTQADLDEIISGLSFGQDQHRIVVSRREPTHHPVTGENVDGTLTTFYRPITEDDIQKQFGGGLYDIRIMGPDPASGRKLVLRKVEQVRIAGEPIFKQAKPGTSSESTKTDDSLLLKVLEQKEKETERLYNEVKEAQRLLLTNLSKPKDDSSLSAMLQLMKDNQEAALRQLREDRLAEERRREEERKREEEKRREEREEARRRADAEERRFQLELEERRRQHERDLLAMQERLRNEAQAQAESNKMLMMFMERGREDERRRQEQEKEQRDQMTRLQLDMVQSSSRQATEMMMEAQKFQTSMLMESLKEAKATKKGGISEMASELMALKELQRNISGEADEEPPTAVERVLDRAEKFLPSLASVAGGMLAARGQRQQLQQPMQMAVVDRGPVNEEQQYLPPAPAAAPAPQPQVAAEDETDEDDEEDLVDNDYTEFVFPAKGSDQRTVVEALIKNLDLAIQKDLDAVEIADKVLAPFATDHAMVYLMLKGATADQLVELIEGQVPEHWAISSPHGETTIRELHALAQTR